MGIFGWINDQLLRMEWLYDLVERLVTRVFGLSMGSPLGASVHFFLYDVVKILILLSFLVFGISYVQSFFPPERTRKLLCGLTGIRGNVVGALLGTLTPFCSCSSIPLFIGFTNAGLPLGITFSFLISSPMVDLASVILLASIFNFRIALAYVFVGLVLAVAGGTIISHLKMEDEVEAFVFNNMVLDMEEQVPAVRERVMESLAQVLAIVKKVWKYILIGVGIGALIHNWIPQSYVAAVLGQDKWYSVLIATFVGVPMYADIFGILPIAQALLLKGVGLGTVLAFMMGVTTLSVPSMVMLKNVIKPKLLGVFIAIVTVGIILIGYTFNAFSVLFLG